MNICHNHDVLIVSATPVHGADGRVELAVEADFPGWFCQDTRLPR